MEEMEGLTSVGGPDRLLDAEIADEAMLVGSILHHNQTFLLQSPSCCTVP